MRATISSWVVGFIDQDLGAGVAGVAGLAGAGGRGGVRNPFLIRLTISSITVSAILLPSLFLTDQPVGAVEHDGHARTAATVVPIPAV